MMIGANIMHQQQTVADTVSGEFLNVMLCGCPHVDVEIEPELSPGATGRMPITRMVEASIDAGYFVKVFNVLGDWTGKQSIDPQELQDITDLIHLDLNTAKSLYESTYPGNAFNVKSISGNHIGQAGALTLYQTAVDDWMTANIDRTDEIYNSPDGTVNNLVSDYKWECFHYTQGNVIFFFMGDRNDIPYPWGKDGSGDGGGHPAGAISFSTLQRFIDVAIRHLDYNMITQTHQGLPDTVVGTKVGECYYGHNNNPLPVQDYKGNVAGFYDPSRFGTTNDTDTNPYIWKKIFDDFSKLSIFHANAHTHAPIGFHDEGGDHFGRLNQTECSNIGCLTQWHGSQIQSFPTFAGTVDGDFQTPNSCIAKFIEGKSNFWLQRLISEDRTVFNSSDTISHGEVYVPYNRSYNMKHAYNPNHVNAIISAPLSVSGVTFSNNVLSWVGDADGYMIVGATTAPSFNFTDGNAAHVPSYEIAAGEILESVTNKTSITIDSQNTFFKIVPFNAGGGDVKYGPAVTI